MISILNAATSNLASLINRLDLQATPDASAYTPGSRYASRDPTGAYGTPAKREELNKSPSKKSPRKSPIISSLRPYSRVRDSTATGESTSNYGPVFSLPDRAVQLEIAPTIPELSNTDGDSEPVFTRGPIAPLPPAANVLKPSGRSRPNLRSRESKISMRKSKLSVSSLFLI